MYYVVMEMTTNPEAKMTKQSTYVLSVNSEKTGYTTKSNSPKNALAALAAAAGLDLVSQDGRYGKLADGRSVMALTQNWGRAHYSDARTTRV